MKRNGSIKITFFLLLIWIIQTKGQDMHWSQVQATPMWTNPALTGDFGGDMRFIANYRNQWQSIPAPFNTAMFSVDTKIQVANSFNHFGIGLSAFKDIAGDLGFNTTAAHLSVAYNMYLGSLNKSDFYVYVGAQYGRVRQSYDPTAARLENPGMELNWLTALAYNDFSGGINAVWVKPKFFIYGGAAIAHLNSPNISFGQVLENQETAVELSPRLTTHLAANINLRNSQNTIIPVVQYLVQAEQSALLFGADFMFNNLKQKRTKTTLDWTIGLHHRWQDALIMSTKFRFSEQYNFGISYDLPVSKIQSPSNAYGGVEVFISLTIPRKIRQGDSPRQGGGLVKLKCPTVGAKPNEKNVWFRENGIGY